MKKKITKKLELSKETLRNLERAELPEALGGYSEYCPSFYVVCKHPPSDPC
jgi:hypothetical protein